MNYFVRIIGCRREKDKRRLEKIIRNVRDVSVVKRAQVVKLSVEGRKVPEIAGIVGFCEKTVRKIIHRFNQQGFSSLQREYRGGRPRKFDEETRQNIVAMLHCNPRDLGFQINTWSLAHLAEAARERGLVESISPQTVRSILKEHRITYRRTKTWKEPKDPLLWEKWNRIKALYKSCPKGAAVVCFDELGPISLVPQGGRAFSSLERPRTVPATYHRKGGISYFLGAYDVRRNWLWGQLVRRRTKDAVLSFLRRLRRKYPPWLRIYLILDNLNIHRSKEIKRWARENRVILVYTAVNASWQNRIEAQFSAIRKHVFENSYWTDHEHLRDLLKAYCAWRNRRKAVRFSYSQIPSNRKVVSA